MAHPRQWARVGMGIEVRLPEPLFRGAWWEGELLEMTNQSAHVRIHAFAARDGCEERLDEWVPWGRTRPTPPPPPTDFLRATRFGEPVEIWWADGWWEATLVAIARPAEREKSVEEQAAAAVAAQAAAPPPAAEVVMAEAEEGVAGGEAAAAAGAPSATSPARRRSSRAIVTKEADALAPSFPPWEQTTVIVTRRSARMQRHAVHPSQLRPGWQWKGTWSAPCIASVTYTALASYWATLAFSLKISVWYATRTSQSSRYAGMTFGAVTTLDASGSVGAAIVDGCGALSLNAELAAVQPQRMQRYVSSQP